MERRLRTFGGRHECADLDELLALIRRDADVKDRFLDHMTINVSELFRNPERFEELERRWLPELQRTARGGLKVWSAGCSYGAEPYSLAVLLQELTSGTPGQVLASDLDAVILARARRGRFGDQDLKNVTPARVAKWFRREDADGQAAWQVSERLKAMVRFRQHNLLTDRYPDGLDLIACRNVVIYFTDEAKDEIYRRFLAALRPGGMLFVGSTERVNGAEAMGWERAGSFFYRRPG
jgi:chemotaxis protein methyltransferase CheR